jgi:hypothetical protein
MLDATQFLSREARARRPSLIKSFYPIMLQNNMLALAGGLPHPSTFSVRNLEIDLEQIDQECTNSTIQLPKNNNNVPNSAALNQFLQYCPGTGWNQTIDVIRATLLDGDKGPKYNDWGLIITHGNTMALESEYQYFVSSLSLQLKPCFSVCANVA